MKKPTVITISKLKGGCGASTIAINLGFHLSKEYKVLFMDLDSQASLTDYLLRDEKYYDQINRRNSYHFITDKYPIRECIIEDVMPCHIEMQKASVEMAHDPGSLFRSRKIVREMSGYDFIIIDTPPKICYEFHLALYCSDLIIVPVAYDRWTMRSVKIMREEIEKCNMTLGQDTVWYIVPSIVSRSGKQTKNIINSMDMDNISYSQISRSPSVCSSLRSGKPIRENTKAYIEFERLKTEILEIL